jgi:hypothetical protein
MTISIKNIDFKNGTILLHLNDGRLLQDTITNFPKLSKATYDELCKYELWDNGRWIHWENLNEDLGLEGFLNNSKLVN